MLHGHANFYEKRDFRVGKVKFFCKTVHTFPSYYTLWHCCVCVISTREIAWFVLLSSIPRAPFLSALSTQSGCWNVPSRKRGSLKLHWIPRFFFLSLSLSPLSKIARAIFDLSKRLINFFDHPSMETFLAFSFIFSEYN